MSDLIKMNEAFDECRGCGNPVCLRLDPVRCVCCHDCEHPLRKKETEE